MPAPAPESEPAIVMAFGGAGYEKLNELLASAASSWKQKSADRRLPRRERHVSSSGMLPSLRRYEPDQVRRVGGHFGRLSARRAPLATVSKWYHGTAVSGIEATGAGCYTFSGHFESISCGIDHSAQGEAPTNERRRRSQDDTGTARRERRESRNVRPMSTSSSNAPQSPRRFERRNGNH